MKKIYRFTDPILRNNISMVITKIVLYFSIGRPELKIVYFDFGLKKVRIDQILRKWSSFAGKEFFYKAFLLRKIASYL